MYRRCFLAAALVVVLAAPAVAAEYYVAQNATDKTCSVAETKPDGKTMMMVGPTSYKTKDEADKAMKAAADCKK